MIASAIFAHRFIRRTILALVPWWLMDVVLYGIGLFTPTILCVLDVCGVNATGLEPWLAKDIRSTAGPLALHLFLMVGLAIAILLKDHMGRLLQKLGFVGERWAC